MGNLNIVQVNRIEGKFFIQNLSEERERWMSDAELVCRESRVKNKEECINVMYEAVGAPTEGDNKPELRISKNADRAIKTALDMRQFFEQEITGKPNYGFVDDVEDEDADLD